MELQNTINRCSIISKGPTINIAGTLSDKKVLEIQIALGQHPYDLTPCPVTGGHHDPLIYLSDAGGTWVDIECKACKWKSLGVLNITEDEVIDRFYDDDGADDIPVSDLLTMVPDDSFQEDWLGRSSITIDLTTIRLWKETIYGIGGTSIVSQLGLDPVDAIYHTSSKMPFQDPNNPQEVIWPI